MTIQVGDASANPVFTDVTATGSPGALNATVTATLRGQSSATVQVTAIGSMTLTFEGTTDGTNFDPILGTPIAGGAATSTTTANGHWVNLNVAGLASFRVRVSAFTSGTATVTVIASQGSALPNYTAGGLQKIDLASENGTALGTPANFGTSPGAVASLGVNSSVFIGTTVATAAAAGIQKVGISGNAGVSLDGATGAAVPANAVLVAGGSVAGGTNVTALTVKAASTAAAATDTSLVVQPLVGSAVMSTAASGVQKVGIVGGAAGANIDGAIAAAPPANALQIGIKAATANPANATAGNQVAIMADKAGRPVVTPGNVRELIGVQTTAIANSTAETTVITAGGAGVFNDLSHIDFNMTNAGTPAAVTLTLKDATAGTTRAVFFLGATAATFAETISFDYPVPISQAAANNNWTITVTGAATVTVNVNAVFVKNT